MTKSNSLRNVSFLSFPCLMILVFLMHFRRPQDFFHFHLQYVPRDPDSVVKGLIRMHNNWPLLHDPHMIAYLALPLVPMCAYGLFLIGKTHRPVVSGIGLVVTVSGSIYTGGIFGMWTAFYRGLGSVDAKYTDGAIATFSAMTANQGAFLFTTTMAKLMFVGFAIQALALIGVQSVPNWAVGCVVTGCILFLAFWDLDNWMLIGMVLMLCGFLPMRRAVNGDGSSV